MDIFTTVLTRVVPVPIKPANLKVKALLKEAGTGKLKEDFDHLENHDYYFNEVKADDDSSEQDKNLKKQTEVDSEAKTLTNENQLEEGVSVSKDGVKHLDLYV